MESRTKKNGQLHFSENFRPELNAAPNMKLILEIDDMGVIRWLIDFSHQCYDDCKGQTGAGMTMGKGAMLSGSLGQKCNTKSSTETKIVGVDQHLPTVLWSK